MTSPAPILARLQAMLDQPGLSPRAAARCQRLIDQLQAPVRIAVFGLPDTGKAAVINALAEAVVLRPGAQSAPVLLSHADTTEIMLTHVDGRKEPASMEMPLSLPDDVLFAEVALPLDSLHRMSLMNVAAEPSPRNMAAALNWASSRCDIAVWCTRNWSEPEQNIWQNGPDSLKHHALLVATDGADAFESTTARDCGIEQNLCAVSLENGNLALSKSSSDMVRRRLSQMIDEAQAEDLDAAVLFIEQYGPQAPAVPEERTLSSSSGDLRLVSSNPESNVEPNGPSPEARAALTRVFLHLRQTAGELLATLNQKALTEDEAETLLSRLHEAFDTVVDLADAEHAFAETWPDLHLTLCDANELVLLLKIEGTTAQAVEAALLLSQVRQDVEFALAA